MHAEVCAWGGYYRTRLFFEYVFPTIFFHPSPPPFLLPSPSLRSIVAILSNLRSISINFFVQLLDWHECLLSTMCCHVPSRWLLGGLNQGL